MLEDEYCPSSNESVVTRLRYYSLEVFILTKLNQNKQQGKCSCNREGGGGRGDEEGGGVCRHILSVIVLYHSIIWSGHSGIHYAYDIFK